MDPVTGLSLGRIVIGIAALISPTLTAKLFGLDSESNPHLPPMTRMFGAREVALGGVTLVSSGSTRRNLTVVGIAVDGADAVTGAIEIASNRVPKLSSGMLAGVAAGAVGAGIIALVRNRG